MFFPTIERRCIGGRCGHRQQRGAVAIEFAVLFMVFFTVLYAIIAYSVPLLLTLTFNQLSADAARAAVRVDPAIGAARYAQAVSNVIKSEVENSWLPENWRGGGCDNPPANTGLTWDKLETPYGFLATETLGSVERVQLHVCLQRKYNKGGDSTDGAIIPVLSLPGLDIPSLPKEGNDTILRGRSTIRL